jgi:hypothetical protein
MLVNCSSCKMKVHHILHELFVSGLVMKSSAGLKVVKSQWIGLPTGQV